MKKKGEWSFVHIMGLLIMIAIIIWAIVYYTEIGERTASILEFTFK